MFPHYRQTRRTVSLAAACAAACVLAGCGGGSSGGSPATGTAPSSPSPNLTTAQPGPTTRTSGPAGPSSTTAGSEPENGGAQARLLRAGATAEGAVPHSTLISIETEAGGKRWEAQVVTDDGTEHEMDLSRSGQKVVSGPTTKHEDGHDKAKHRRRIHAAKLTYREAADKIHSAVSGGHVTELNLDTYRGTTVWEGDVVTGSGTKHAIKLDARTGKVLVNKTGRAD